MQLVENPIKGPFETQHDGRKNSQIVARRVLLGNYPFQLLAKKFQGDPLCAHASEHGRDQPLASTPMISGFRPEELTDPILRPQSAFIAALKMGDG
jgi:hypothetical protein